MFPKIEIPQNGWFIVEYPIKMDDLGVPLFSETSMYGVNIGVFHPLIRSPIDPITKPFPVHPTVDGTNAAPVDMVNIPLSIGFHTSQVVQDVFHQQYRSGSDKISRPGYSPTSPSNTPDAGANLVGFEGMGG